MFLCLCYSFLDLISKIIQSHYFIRQLLVVTSCQFIYRIEIAHPTDGGTHRRTAARSDTLWLSNVRQRMDPEFGVHHEAQSDLFCCPYRKREESGVEFCMLAGLLTHVKGSSHS